MKKYVSVLFFSIMIGCTFAQTSKEEGIISGNVRTISHDINMSKINNSNKIKTIFCESEQKGFYKNLIRPGERKNICIGFLNASDESVKINYGFSSGRLDNGIPLCDNRLSFNNPFAKNILHLSETKIDVPAKTTIFKKFTFLSPRDATGTIFGCLLTQVDSPEAKIQEGLFTISVSKAGYIQFDITGDVYQLRWLENMKDYFSIHKNSILIPIIIGLTITIIAISLKKPKKRKNK